MTELEGFNIADGELNFLIAADSELCQIIADCLEERAKTQGVKIKIYQCELVSEIQKICDVNFGVDYLIFAYDGRVTPPVSKVTENICHVNENYLLSSRSCLVNCNSVARNNRYSLEELSALCKKYNLHYIAADLNSTEGKNSFAERIFGLVSTLLATKTGSPLDF